MIGWKEKARLKGVVKLEDDSIFRACIQYMQDILISNRSIFVFSLFLSIKLNKMTVFGRVWMKENSSMQGKGESLPRPLESQG